jgi:hypothetical protein
MVWEFPAVSQTRKEFWGESQYNRKGMLVFTVLFGALGLHHLMLRSPQTAVLFFFANLFSFGYCYWFDILQLAGTPTKDLNQYGLALPWQAAGIAQGMWKCGEDKEASDSSPPSPWWFTLYSLLLPLGPLASLIAGDSGGAMAKFLGILFIIVLFPFTIISLGFDYYKLLLKPADVLYNGASRFFPFTFAGWMPDGMSPRLTGEGRVKAADDSNDSILVRFWKGMITACLPFLRRVLPFDLVAGIELAVSTGQAVKQTVEKVVTTGVKVATKLGEIATEVPAAAGPALAKAAAAAADPSALLAAQEAKLAAKVEGKIDSKIGQLSQLGGGSDSLSLGDKVIGGGLAAVLVGGFLLTIGRSFHETVFHFDGITDSPPRKS